MGINQNSWKTIQFNLVAGTVLRLDLQKVYFDGNFVLPNFIQIRNINTSDILYVGDDKLVSSTSYRLSINPLATGKSINIDGYSSIYLLCASSTNKVELNYAYDNNPSGADMDGTQDITVINQSLTVSNVSIDGVSAGGNDLTIEADGSLNVNTTLSAGTNSIGKVTQDTHDNLNANANIQQGNIDVGSGNELYTRNSVLGSKTDDKNSATDTTSLSAIQILKYISYCLQNSIPAGDNNIGNVDLASSIPAGTNNIGKIGINNGTYDLAIEADGSINVNGATFSGTIGTVKLEDSTGTYFLNIDSNGYITTKISGSIPTGSNNIGKISIDDVDAGELVKPPTTPVIYNVTCVSASTEYSQALPSNCKKFSIGIKSKNSSVKWVLKFGTGGTQFEMNGSETYSIDDVYLASQTLYFESDTASEVIQIIAYS